MKKVVYFLLAILLFWLALSLVLRLSAPSILFDEHESKNYEYGVEFESEFMTNSAGEKLEMVIVPRAAKTGLNDEDQVLLYFSGNDGRIDYILQGASKKMTVFSPAYPGYSRSDGKPSEDGVKETVDLAMRFLHDRGYIDEQILVLGHSMGGFPAVYASTRYPNLRGVILVNTFYSMQEMCRDYFYIFCEFTGDFFNTSEMAPYAQSRIFQFHSAEDELIPFEQGDKLFQLLGAEKEFQAIDGKHRYFDVEAVLGNF